MDQLRSVSAPGNSIVIATFNLDRNVDTAAQDVRDRVATVVRSLPPDARPPVVQKFDNDSQPVITIALSADRSLRELSEFANFTVKLQLERAGGVGQVQVVGNLDRAINIWIDAERLAAYHSHHPRTRVVWCARTPMCPVGMLKAAGTGTAHAGSLYRSERDERAGGRECRRNADSDP
jgi:hypothetical protein